MDIIDTELLMNDGMDVRKEVLINALILEEKSSIFLAELLGIDLSDSKILNGSSSISFNQKIMLLIEVGALNTNDKSKFIKFMECRNKFMHNINVNTYEKCFPVKSDGYNYLVNNYTPPDNTDLETKLKNAFNLLTDDVLNLMDGIINVIDKKIHEEFDKNYTLYQLKYEELINKYFSPEFSKYRLKCHDENKEFSLADFFRLNKEELDFDEFNKDASKLKNKYYSLFWPTKNLKKPF
jgi:hypothetical protein